MLGGNSFIKDVYYAAMFLQMETLKERIIVGIGLTIKDKVELEDEENIREEIKNRVKKLLQKKV